MHSECPMGVTPTEQVSATLSLPAKDVVAVPPIGLRRSSTQYTFLDSDAPQAPRARTRCVLPAVLINRIAGRSTSVAKARAAGYVEMRQGFARSTFHVTTSTASPAIQMTRKSAQPASLRHISIQSSLPANAFQHAPWEPMPPRQDSAHLVTPHVLHATDLGPRAAPRAPQVPPIPSCTVANASLHAPWAQRQRNGFGYATAPLLAQRPMMPWHVAALGNEAPFLTPSPKIALASVVVAGLR